MASFHSSKVNFIEDDSGSYIRILGPTGLHVLFEGRVYDLFSEMLNTPMSIMLDTVSFEEAGPDRARLLSFVRDGLEWNGFDVKTM